MIPCEKPVQEILMKVQYLHQLIHILEVDLYDYLFNFNIYYFSVVGYHDVELYKRHNILLLCFQVILLIIIFKNTKIMDNDVAGRMIDTLKSAIQWAEQRERKIMAEVLNIEKKINYLQDTKPIVRKKEVIETKKQQVKEENPTEQFHKKIDEIITKAQQEIQILEKPQKSKPPITQNKPKVPESLPQIEKKPPVPTVNRAKQSQSFIPKPNYHYTKNKNEVTGKITQTPFIKQGGKGNSSVTKKEQNTKNIFSQSAQKNSTYNSTKNIPKQQAPNITSSTNKIPPSTNEMRKQNHSADEKNQNQPKREPQKITYIDFKKFRIPLEELIGRNSQKDKRKIGSKKQAIEKLINDYDKEELGHRQNQKKSVKNFLASASKLAVTRSRLPLPSGLKIEPRYWQGHIQIFNFTNILDHFQNLLDRNPISQQYNLDPKEVYRIKCWHQIINQIFEQEIVAAHDSLKLPPKLGIDFDMNTNESTDIELIGEEENSENKFNPYLGSFYQLLEQQLEELKSLQNFGKDSLKKLRVLISIGLYKGKKCPIMIQVPKYEQWKNYYDS